MHCKHRSCYAYVMPMKQSKYTFRQAQSAFDLISILQSINDARIISLGGDPLVGIIRDSACHIETENEAKCYEALASEALEAGANAEIAVAVLVANELQHGLWSGDAKELAEFSTERLKRSSPAIRSAILRGLDTLERSAVQYEPATYLLPNESRLSREMNQIIPKLCDVARSIDQQTLAQVAASDRGYLKDEHLAALKEVLSDEECRFPKDEVWVPSEVVELVAHVRGALGFVQCTALLLANALPVRDRMGWFDFRWENLGKEYNTLPDSTRSPILAGIRYLYESDSEFLWYSEKKFWDPVRATEQMIHLVDLPDDNN